MNGNGIGKGGSFFGGNNNQYQYQQYGYHPSSPASSSSLINNGGRGIKHAGVGIIGFGGNGNNRRNDPMDDNASIASLIDRDNLTDDGASYNGHNGGGGGAWGPGSEGGHSYSNHQNHYYNNNNQDDGFLMPGVPNRITNYPTISNKHIPQHPALKNKTSYKDFKNSEHKILSNEE